jgi:FkbM family methyltransferase
MSDPREQNERFGGYGRSLQHFDRKQLLFQIHETMRERAYLQHGVEVRPGDVVFDVGANVGVAAVFFAAECQAGVVHSFEPVAPLYEYLRMNTEPYPACVAHPYGLSDLTQHATIAYYPTAAAMSSLYADPEADAELVRTCLVNRGATREEAERAVPEGYRARIIECDLRRTSDAIADLAEDQIDLLKIDVEKAELDVMHGISDACWGRVKQVAAEVHDDEGRLAQVTALLHDHGFDVVAEQGEVMRGTGLYMVFATR